jgi:uncharacterized protein (DUF427 family)
MGLTNATGPFSREPTGRFNIPVDSPTGAVLFWDSVPQRIRVRFAGETVVDTLRAKLLHETGHLPVYYVPEDDIRRDLLEPSSTRTHCPHKGEASYWTLRVGDRVAEDAIWFYPEPIEHADFLRGHAAFYWNKVDEWYAEDEQLFGHPRDPHARIDVYPTSRRVRILVGAEQVADTVRAKVLFESNLPPRYYIPPEDVRLDLLDSTSKHTRCAYKGLASYWSVGDEDDVAWAYPEPQHDAEPVRDMIAFFNERVDIEVDGQLQDRPRTQWSR